MNQLKKQTSKPAKVTCMAVLLGMVATLTACSDKTGTVNAEEPVVLCEEEFAKQKDTLMCTNGGRNPKVHVLTVSIPSGEVQTVAPPNPRVCPEDVIRWNVVPPNKDIILWFKLEDPVYSACNQSKNGKLYCIVKSDAPKGCRKYSIVAKGGKNVLDPYIIVE